MAVDIITLIVLIAVAAVLLSVEILKEWNRQVYRRELNERNEGNDP